MKGKIMASNKGKNKATKAKASKAKARKPKPAPEPIPEVEAGTWQATIVQSATLKKRGDAAAAKAGTLLWTGSQAGITDWLGEAAALDKDGEGFYNELISLLGRSRKGDASKIKTVALAARDAGLVLSTQPSLSKAYAEAKRLTVTAVRDKEDDHAADTLLETIEAPKTTGKPEGAAQILLSKGVDETTRLLVDAVIDKAGNYEDAEPVLRSLLRSFVQEVNGRKPKPEPKAKAAPKEKAAPKGKAPVKPNPKSARKTVEQAEAEQAEKAAAEQPVEADVDAPDPVEDEAPAKAEKPVKAKAKPLAKPIQRRG